MKKKQRHKNKIKIKKTSVILAEMLLCECVEVSVSRPVLVAVVEYSKRCRQIICDAGSFIATVDSTRQLDFVFSGAGWNVGSGRADDVSTWQCDLPVAAAAKVSRRETL